MKNNTILYFIKSLFKNDYIQLIFACITVVVIFLMLGKYRQTPEFFADIWDSVMIMMLVFYVACHTIPKIVYGLQSMPYTYQIKNNFGKKAFNLQVITYANYHTVTYNIM
ncbi:MAG: hypothetical protein QM528_08205 [Phycisphaerales bacterium]|nr:hypothetical protein [Phycisphaerales bacterium]